MLVEFQPLFVKGDRSKKIRIHFLLLINLSSFISMLFYLGLYCSILDLLYCYIFVLHNVIFFFILVTFIVVAISIPIFMSIIYNRNFCLNLKRKKLSINKLRMSVRSSNLYRHEHKYSYENEVTIL